MAIFDLLELADLFTSWRFYVGAAVTVTIVIGLDQLISNETASMAICVPVAIVGVVLSIYWDFRKR